MKPSKLCLWVLFCLSITGTGNCVTAEIVRVGFSSAGLSSIRYEGNELLARGNLEVNAVGFASDGGQISAGAVQHSTRFDVAGKVERLVFNWGTVAVHYLAQPQQLVLRITTTNKSRTTLRSLSLDALALHLPRRPAEYDGVVPMLATNIGSPSVVPLTYGTGALVLRNEDVRRPLLVGFPWSLDKPASQTFPLRINTGREPMYPDSLPFIDRPIPPGGSDRFDISLQFKSASVRPPDAAPDLFALFRALHPFTLSWPDRRPIGSLIIATAAAGWPTNPRGWLLDPKLDVTSARGIAQFQQRLLAWADRSVVILTSMHAQGMVTWDIEGEQFPHATTYIGDPRVAETLAPEMRGVIDEYFARFRRAGLRVGVTIRPQAIVVSADGKKAQQTQPPDPAQLLIDKIAYARKRWGATLFYIDSNGDQALPLSFDTIKRVTVAEPDVLLMPEHKNAAYYSATAPYSELRGGFASTPDLARSIYHQAFSVINTADGALDRYRAKLGEGIKRGDIVMFRAWFDDPANIKLKRLLVEAGAQP